MVGPSLGEVVGAYEVFHHGVRVAGSWGEGQAGDGADVEFELAGGAGVDGPVAGVVGAGRHFVDEEVAVCCPRTFRWPGGRRGRRFSGDGGSRWFAGGFGDGSGLMLGGGEREVEDVVAVAVFHGVEGGDLRRWLLRATL